MTIEHCFVLALSAADNGELLGEYPVTPDLRPAAEEIALRRLRAGSDVIEPDGAGLRVEPVWDPARGEPHVAAVLVANHEHSATLPLRYFRRHAQSIGKQLVEEKKLADGAKFNFELLAYRAPDREPEPALPFTVREVATTLPFRDADVAEMLGRATPIDAPDAENFPVFIEAQALVDARTCTRAADGVETGGVLIGHLLRDPATRDIALWLTAQIPARHAPATSAKLSFTPDTWVDVRAAIALRGRGELMLGTWHSHPAVAWCAKCSPEHRRECALRLPFFSDDDVLLTRTVCSRAYCVGLVITHAHDGLHHGLFGWQSGLIEARGFHLLGELPDFNATQLDDHATPATTPA